MFTQRLSTLVVFCLLAGLSAGQTPGFRDDDDGEKRARAQALFARTQQTLGLHTPQAVHSLSASAKLQRFIRYVSVQSPTRTEEKERVIGGKVEWDFAMPDKFRKRLSSATLNGFGYAYSEIVNGDKAWRDPPSRVRSAAGDSRVVDVRDVERTLNWQTQTSLQQVSIFTLLCLLQTPSANPLLWRHLGEYNFEGSMVELVWGEGAEGFNPFVLLDKQTARPRAIAFTYAEAIRPTVLPEIAALDRGFIRQTMQRVAWERRARMQPIKRHEMRWLLGDYRTVNGVTLPYRITVMRDQEKLEELTVNEYKLNRRINPKKFKGEPQVKY